MPKSLIFDRIKGLLRSLREKKEPSKELRNIENIGVFVPPSGEKEKEAVLVPGKVWVISVNRSAMKNILREASDVKNKYDVTKLYRIAQNSGIKPVMFVPLQKLYISAALNAYNKLRERFGDRLKAFALVGGALTANMSGVPIKVVPEEAPFGRRRRKQKQWSVYPVLDDLDVAAIVENLTEEERKEAVKIVQEAVKEAGLPPDVVDDSRPFILRHDEHDKIAHFFHEEKPKLFFDRTHVEYVKEVINKPEVRKHAEREAKMYRQKLSLYVKYMDEKLSEIFNKVFEAKDPEKLLSRDEKAVLNNLDLFLFLFDSLYFRRLVDNLIMELPKKGVPAPEANRRARIALAKVIKAYMDMASEVGKYAHLTKFEDVQRSRKLIMEKLKKTEKR